MPLRRPSDIPDGNQRISARANVKQRAQKTHSASTGERASAKNSVMEGQRPPPATNLLGENHRAGLTIHVQEEFECAVHGGRAAFSDILGDKGSMPQRPDMTIRRWTFAV